MFRLIKLNPPHGWNAVAWELAIVTLGVLMALAAQQMVEKWRWRQDVERTRADLDDEILYNLALGAERIAVNRCLSDRLRTLGLAVAKSDGRWTAISEKKVARGLRALPVVYGPPSRVYTTDVWEQAKANGILNHMDPADIQYYSEAYEQIAYMRRTNEDEHRLMPGLTFLAFDGRLDPSARERALATIAALDSHNNWMVLVTRQVAQLASQSKRRPSRGSVRAQAEVRFDAQRKLRGPCVDMAAGWKVLGPRIAK